MAGTKKGMKRKDARELIEDFLKQALLDGAESISFGALVDEEHTFGDLVRALSPKAPAGGRPTREELLEALESGDEARIAEIAERERQALILKKTHAPK